MTRTVRFYSQRLASVRIRFELCVWFARFGVKVQFGSVRIDSSHRFGSDGSVRVNLTDIRSKMDPNYCSHLHQCCYCYYVYVLHMLDTYVYLLLTLLVWLFYDFVILRAAISLGLGRLVFSLGWGLEAYI
jgi:hypothetical protein